MEAVIGLIIGILIAAVISGAVIWLVGKMNLGLTVSGFGSAMIAGLFIGIITNLVMYLVPGLTGLVGAVVHLIVSAAVILLAGKVLSGLKVDGFTGALLAAVVMALIGYAMVLLLGGIPAATA